MKPRENAVERYLVQRLDNIGITCLKFLPDNCVGMPDRLALLPDQRVVWIELKTQGGQLSEVQKYRHKLLTRTGHRVEVLWDTADVDRFVDSIVKAH